MLLLLAFLYGCQSDGCLDGAEGCEVPSPCPDLPPPPTCTGGSTEVRVIGPGETGPGGMDALASPGDYILGNDQVVAVIESLDHPHYLGPTGGNMVDLATRDGANDSMRHLFTVVGLLPGEAAHYTRIESFDEGDVKAVQVVGTLDGYPSVGIATRYEVRPCEPGVRIRTELINGGTFALTAYLTDAFYWGGREQLAFTPGPGAGFVHPSFGLSDILTAFRDVPYMVSGLHVDPATTYGVVSCEEDTLTGFQSKEISAMGPAQRILEPRDYMVSERFVLAVPGASISAGADAALELRRLLWDEPYVTVSGRLVAPGGQLGQSLRAAILVSEGTASMPAEERIPWTHILPEADGSFQARVPANKRYVFHVEAFGQEATTAELEVGEADADVGTLTLPAVGEVTLDVTVDGAQDHALVFVIPADDSTADLTASSLFGVFEDCAPLLGPHHGGSPACNRVLVDGPTTIALPPGSYSFYTSAGPFSTLGAVEDVAVSGTTAQSVLIEVATLGLQPEGTLSGDFHVHGSTSFDSQIPDVDRVKAFLASRIQVVASTEHDTVSNYADAMTELGAYERMALIEGTESTGHILFPFRDDYGFPQVVGHWNFWPVPYDASGPYRGAAWDELAEPGLLMTRQQAAGWDDVDGIAQLNHPIGGIQFGRDYSWGTAAGYNLLEPLKTTYDGTGQSLYFHKPEGAAFANDAYDVQEVMNGTNNAAYLQYRAFWFYLLDQGIVRGGTANSDSHSLTENVIGTPRNLVTTSTTLADFDLATFDADVRAGHILGTNGPLIDARVVDGAQSWIPGVEAISPGSSATLELTVSAAPWIPVDEVRILVNGVVVETIGDLPVPADRFGVEGTLRYTASIPLADLLDGSGDAWIILEAGRAMEPNEDLDCNGIPDTGDNNGDGTIDWRDVEELTEDPGVNCYTTVGPLTEPPPPDRDSEDWYFATVNPGGYPLAFTNPFILDRDGGGFAGVAR